MRLGSTGPQCTGDTKMKKSGVVTNRDQRVSALVSKGCGEKKEAVPRRFLFSVLCPHCRQLIPAIRHRGTRSWESPAVYMRARRAAYRTAGVCTACGWRTPESGRVRCHICNSWLAWKKRKRRRIGLARCPCGNPAVNVYLGEYICPECMKKERGR